MIEQLELRILFSSPSVAISFAAVLSTAITVTDSLKVKADKTTLNVQTDPKQAVDSDKVILTPALKSDQLQVVYDNDEDHSGFTSVLTDNGDGTWTLIVTVKSSCKAGNYSVGVVDKNNSNPGTIITLNVTNPPPAKLQ